VKLEGKGKALNILVTEEDSWEGRPLYQQIVDKAHHEGLAGATTFRGVLGFGLTGLLHDADIEALMTNLPISIFIVDEMEKIDRFVSILEAMVRDGVIQSWEVNVEFYRHQEAEK